MDSRAAPKAAGVSGGSPAGRAYRHGWAILEVPKSALSTGHMETFKKRHEETPRVERQKVKAARRIQRKQTRAGLAGDKSSDDTPKAGPDGSPSVELLTDV